MKLDKKDLQNIEMYGLGIGLVISKKMKDD